MKKTVKVTNPNKPNRKLFICRIFGHNFTEWKSKHRKFFGRNKPTRHMERYCKRCTLIQSTN